MVVRLTLKTDRLSKICKKTGVLLQIHESEKWWFTWNNGIWPLFVTNKNIFSFSYKSCHSYVFYHWPLDFAPCHLLLVFTFFVINVKTIFLTLLFFLLILKGWNELVSDLMCFNFLWLNEVRNVACCKHIPKKIQNRCLQPFLMEVNFNLKIKAIKIIFKCFLQAQDL